VVNSMYADSLLSPKAHAENLGRSLGGFTLVIHLAAIGHSPPVKDLFEAMTGLLNHLDKE
jgi:hypothetical protein